MKRKLLLLCLCAALPVRAEEITVSAAASLKNAFTDIAAAYQKRYPHDRIRLNTAASGVLLRQAAQGAPVDMLAFADEATMNQAAAKRLIDVSSRRVFARNRLVLVVPPSHKTRIRSLKDLQQSQVVRIAIGNPASVPAGAYAQAALQQQQLWAGLKNKMVYAQNVRQVADYVARGEVQAGWVYATDAKLQAARLHTAAVVPTPQPVAYPLALTATAKNRAAATRFSAFVLSADGQAVLRKYGFERP